MNPDRAAPGAWPCPSVHGNATRLAVSVVPNSRRTAVDGLHDGALRVRLAAPPVDGKANEMLVDWLAGQLGLAKRSVRLVRGQVRRRKWLEIDASPEDLAGSLAGVVAPVKLDARAASRRT